MPTHSPCPPIPLHYAPLTDRRYSNGGTFYLTQIYGASASFSFNGTGVWIFGAKRPNHGPYNITLFSGDGASSSSSGNVASFTGNGASAQPIFQTPLFIAKDLPQGMHEVVISNAFTQAGNDFLDIDFVSRVSPFNG